MPLRIRTKLTAIIGTGFLLVMLASYQIFSHFYYENIRNLTQESLRQADQLMNKQIRLDSEKLAAALEVFVGDERFQRLFAARDRQALYAAVLPLHRQLTEQFGITHFYFHLPDGRNFLRVHDQALHDDRIERETLRRSMATGRLCSGVELGRTAFALRVVAPYYRGDALLGYVEFGEEIDHFLGFLHAATRNEYAIVVDKSYLDRDQWQATRLRRGLPDNWDLMQRHLLLSRPAPGIVGNDCLKDKAVERFMQRPGFADDDIRRDRELVCGGFPFRDINGKSVGAVVMLIDVSDSTDAMKRMRGYNLGMVGGVFLLSFLLVSLASGRLITRPIGEISRAARIFAGGDLKKHRVPVASRDEIGQLAEAVNDMAAQLDRLYSTATERSRELEELNRRLEILATTDGLTGLYNHRYFYGKLAEEMARAQRFGRPLSLIIADIDHFKQYNDTYGHLEGDRLLYWLATELVKNARQSDLVARYGGEEFAIILPETDLVTARGVAQRIRQMLVEDPARDGEGRLAAKVTLSYGVASLTEEEDDVESLVRRADRALYAAKDAGRDRVVSQPV